MNGAKALVGAGTLALGLCACGGGASGKVSLSSASASASSERLESSHGSGPSGRERNSRFAEDACAGVDLKPETKRLSVADVRRVLDEHGLRYQIKRERGDLDVFTVDAHGEKVELRVATLKTAREAGRHLHHALLEHGMGYWGVHRSNLAILGSPGSPQEAAGFALESGLACWGVFTRADRDETFVIPGGYFEL